MSKKVKLGNSYAWEDGNTFLYRKHEMPRSISVGEVFLFKSFAFSTKSCSAGIVITFDHSNFNLILMKDKTVYHYYPNGEVHIYPNKN